jgi:hypothetical protein
MGSECQIRSTSAQYGGARLPAILVDASEPYQTGRCRSGEKTAAGVPRGVGAEPLRETAASGPILTFASRFGRLSCEC